MTAPSPPISPSLDGSTHAHASMNDDDGAQNRRELLALLGGLRSMGLTHLLDLPQIAVIGSQSVGKSSLIESLCKMKLPRSAGTCTRCPIECRSRYADHPWRAEIFLRIEQADNPRLAEEVPFGDPIVDPDMIEDRIKQAQIAVLNPDADRDLLLRGGFGPDGGPSFTKNCIVVCVSGNELSDLSFVDLPGIIATATSQENQGDVELVENLVGSYMEKTSTINLIVIDSANDYENQKASSLAKRYDPTGERTIGVLTKPDRIEPGEESRWINMVKGEHVPLRHGWYCVKLPTRAEREEGLTWEEARSREVRYFKTAQGWSTVGGEHRLNLGSKKLASKLGHVLSNELQNRLPDIREELDALIEANDARIRQLPEHCPQGARHLVLQLVMQFVRDVEHQLIHGDASAGRSGVVQQIRKEHVELRLRLQLAQPVFLPRERKDPDDIKESELPRPSFLPDDEEWLTNSPMGNEHSVQKVADDADWARTREWPGHYPFEIILIYMKEVFNRWKGPVETTFSRIHHIFESKMLRLVEGHFSAYSHGGLLDAVKKTALELLKTCRKTTIEALEADRDQELHPESSHEQLYRTYEDNYSNYYRRFFDTDQLRQLGIALQTAADRDLVKALDKLQRCGLPKIEPDQWERIYPIDQSQRSALRVMASVRAHYQIAYKRFVDRAKETVDQKYVRAFGRDVGGVLQIKLGLSSETPDEYFDKLTRESDDMAALRKALEDRGEQLEAARVKLA